MDVHENVKIPATGLKLPSPIQRRRPWDQKESTSRVQPRELSQVPHDRHYQRKQESIFVPSNDSNYHHVSLATETCADTSPELHTLSGHNMWDEPSASQPLANTTNNHVSKQCDMCIPDYRRARGPLKKRLGPPGLTTEESGSVEPTGLVCRTSSSCFGHSSMAAPLLRQATSPLLLQHQNGPPQLRMHPSYGQSLIAEPLLDTPQELSAMARLSNSSSFQPHPSMTFKPAQILSVLRTFNPLPPVVTNPPDFSTTRFREAVPHSTLGRAGSHESSTPGGIDYNNREVALASLHGPTMTSQVASASQILHTMHPFDMSSRERFQGTPRKPNFSPTPPKPDAGEKPISKVIRLPSGTHPRSVASQQPKPKAVTGRPKKVRSGNDSSSGSKDRAKLGTIVKKSSLFKNVPTSIRPCKCGATKCLKLYCECFHNAQFCNQFLCRCTECFNTEAHNSVREPKGARVVAILSILQRRPRAFVHGGRKAVADRSGCNCQKSG
jgi:hypothetical protein